MSASGALLATSTFYSATCIVLYTDRSTIAQRVCDAAGVINILPYNEPCLCQLNQRNCDHQISTTTRVVDDIAYSSASAQSWTRTTVADEHKFSAVRRLNRRILDRS